MSANCDFFLPFDGGVAYGGFLASEALVKSRLDFRACPSARSRPIFWPIRFVATGPTLEAARAELVTFEGAVKTFFAGRGFAETDWSVQLTRHSVIPAKAGNPFIHVTASSENARTWISMGPGFRP